jgi:hypothetical protein
MTLARVAFLAFLMTTNPALAIEGSYAVTGAGVNGAGAYRGVAEIKKTGATYSLVWQVGALRHQGTGILTEGLLSVVFFGSGPIQAPGLATYRVVNGRVAEGTWTVLGGQEVATERMEPSDRI